MGEYQTVLKENNFLDRTNLNYPFEERGLQFGDGIYEVIRVYSGESYLLHEHVDRFYRSAKAIKIEVPYKKEVLIEKLEELLKRNNVTSDAKIYIQMTRGSAKRDHAFPKNSVPNLYAYVEDLDRKLGLFNSGVSAITAPDDRWANCYIKSLNLLPNVLAKQEARDKGCFEAILHQDGLVTECSSSNIYIVKDDRVFTHPATNQILHGCVRMKVEQFCEKLKIPFIEEAFTVDEMMASDEVFMSSSTAEIMPIINIDEKVIHDGKPGKITRLIQDAYVKDAGLTR